MLNIDKARRYADNNYLSSMSVDKHRDLTSMNSLSYDYRSLKALVDKTIKDENITVPPTKESLNKLFMVLNLNVSPVKVIDCLVFCKSAAKKPKSLKKKKDPKTGVEVEEEWVYDTTKLIQWFHLNVRTFKHLDETKVDKNWMNDVTENASQAHQTMVAASWLPHPKAFMRGRTGTGGTHVNRIIKSKSGKRSTAFQEYGIQAETMASTYNY